MEFRWARRMSGMRTSEIREILKLTQRPGMISFAGGLPAAELFPVDRVDEMTRLVFERDGYRALQYSTTEGDPSLRQAIADRMNRLVGAEIGADNVLITSGSQQGLDLAARIFLDPGDVILCESPTYLGAINAFKGYEPRFVEVPTDEDGMIIPELERILEREGSVKLAYVVPEFQNPTGRTWSLERREAFLELMVRHGIPVLEDSPYGEIRFEGEQVPSLISLDTEGIVVFLGTFSKIFCPGLRIGWLAAPLELREKFVMVKQGVDLHTSTLGQRQIATYLEHFDLDADIRGIAELYRKRRDVMLRTMEEEFPPGVSWNVPQGGMFFWVVLPEGLDAARVLERSLELGVAFVPGGPFFPSGGNQNTMRLNYSAMPEERIREGITRLGSVLREMIGEMAPVGTPPEQAPAPEAIS